jgi:hypothetical protein
MNSSSHKTTAAALRDIPMKSKSPMIYQIIGEADWINCNNPSVLLDFLPSIGISGGHSKCWRLASEFLRRTVYAAYSAECFRTIDYCERRALGLVEAEQLPGGFDITTVGYLASAEDLKASQQPLGELASVYLSVHEAYESLRDTVFRETERVVLKAALLALQQDGPRLKEVVTLAARAFECRADDAHLLTRSVEPNESRWSRSCRNAKIEPANGSVPGDRERFNSDLAFQLSSEAHRQQLIIIRDIIGNPFRSPTIRPEWRSTKVAEIVNQIQEEQDFELMSQLADELVAAGCDCTDVLEHCRDEAMPHVDGCWVLEVLTEQAKEDSN